MLEIVGQSDLIVAVIFVGVADLSCFSFGMTLAALPGESGELDGCYCRQCCPHGH